MRNADRFQVLHRPYDFALRESLIPEDGDLADLDLGPFHYVEDNLERRWRNAPQDRSNHGELMAVLGQKLFQYDRRMVDDIRVVHRFDRQSDFPLLEAVENVGCRN